MKNIEFKEVIAECIKHKDFYNADRMKHIYLQYRREHNIFEVGDRVFYTGRANDNDLYTLKEIYSGHDFAVGSNGADKDFWTLFVSEIRHATDEETQAGRRLSKIKCWSCDKEMSHSERAKNDGFCIHCNAEIEL